MSVDDKCTCPGSGGALNDAAGIPDHARLDEAMNGVASFVLAKIHTEPAPERLDLKYLRVVHMRMFGDLLPAIAGRIRDVDVQATGTGIPSCRPDFVETNLDTLFRKLEREDYLTGLDADPFTERLADRWGELSAIHPWRDGNTRSQSMCVSALAQRAGHPIDWASIDVDELRHRRLQAITGTDRPLASYLRPTSSTTRRPEAPRTRRRAALSLPLTADTGRRATPASRRLTAAVSPPNARCFARTASTTTSAVDREAARSTSAAIGV